MYTYIVVWVVSRLCLYCLVNVMLSCCKEHAKVKGDISALVLQSASFWLATFGSPHRPSKGLRTHRLVARARKAPLSSAALVSYESQ